MDLSPSTTTTTVVREKTWLGSQHGTDCPQTITIDVGGGTFAAVMIASTRPGESIIPSGTAVNELPSGLYARASGADVAEGHLFEDVVVKTGSTAAGASLFWHGVVVQAKLPAGSGFVNANRAPFIKYV
jgi:hypothetical protein